MRAIGLHFAFFVITLGVSAQGNDSAWQNLQQLQPGDRIEIVLKSKAKHSGMFVMLADDAITLRARGGESGYPRDEVARVSRLGSARRGRAALIGLAVGAAAGAALGAAAAGSDNGSFIDITVGPSMAAGGVLFGGVGAALGAAVARPARTELYRAP